MLQNVLKVTSLHYSWSNSSCCSYIHWHSHVAEWHLYLYIPKAMVYLCNSGFRDFTPCLQRLRKRKDLCTCWRISPVSYRSCMMAEVSMRYCCYCIFESVWAAILFPSRKFVSSTKCCQSPEFVTEGMQMLQKVSSICVHAVTDTQCQTPWPFWLLECKSLCWMLLSNQIVQLNNTKWNRWKW